MMTLKNIWTLLLSRQRIFLIMLFGAMLINACFEAASIGLILPMIKLIGKSSAIQDYPWLIRLGNYFGIVNHRDILIALFCVYAGIFLLKTCYTISITFFKLHFVARTLRYLSSKLLKVYLFSNWAFHLQRNTAELQNNIINQVGSICTGMLDSILTLCVELLIVSFIAILLILINPLSSILAILLIGIVCLTFFYIVRKRLEYYGSVAQIYSAKMIKSVNEAFGGIKETKILGREDYFINSYSENNRMYAKAWIFPSMTHQVQRSVVEILFIGVVIVISLYILYSGHGGMQLLSTLALFVAAAFRLMPSFNRINNALSSIRYYTPIVNTIHNDIKLIDENKKKRDNCQPSERINLKIEKCIELQNVSFRYPGASRNSLISINLYIPKGYSIGFAGPSGAGKTTTADIILGLLKPVSGKVLVDGYDIFENLEVWQRLIGYIPQNIYLTDNSIRCNVAFGLEEDDIDDRKVWAAIKKAQLYDVIKELPNGLDNLVGEHGLRLSGGQRQRISIARALYNDPEVLVMDEATSSLDVETEKEITKAIERLSGEKTIIIITHRQSTIEKCDMKCYFNSGKIQKIITNNKI